MTRSFIVRSAERFCVRIYSFMSTLVGWFKQAPCGIEDFIFVDASTIFICLRALPTTESSKKICHFQKANCVMNEPISLIIWQNAI